MRTFTSISLLTMMLVTSAHAEFAVPVANTFALLGVGIIGLAAWLKRS